MARQRVVLLAAAVAVLLGGLVLWLVWPDKREAPPRARPYLEYTACLLTDGQGVAGPPAAAVWAGMQDASLATHAKVQYLPVVGEPTVGNALPYLANLVQRRCAVVFAVGPAQVAAVAADAANHPGVRFIVASGASASGASASGASASGANVKGLDVSDPGQVRGRVDRLLRDAVRATTQ
jgi:hypothetical protein